MSLEETKEIDDIVVEAGEINFVLDPQAHKHAQGVTVDYKQSIFGKGFSIKSSSGENC